MNMLDKLMLAIYTFCIGILSIVLILFPFDNIWFLSDENLNVYLQNMKGEFVFSVIGVAFLLASIRFFPLSTFLLSISMTSMNVTWAWVISV